ncbi:hypothetical protein [Alkalicoccobacillus gibsonii]|uniref:hypothetical protein n=1 Tax=Alkalicoccobacillus gibsonii TaxID=79881 RepID=UPI0035186B17
MKAVSTLLEELNISKILFIDDQLQLSDDDKMTLLEDYLTQGRENQELRDDLAACLTEYEIEMVYEEEDFEFLREDPVKREDVLSFLSGYNPELFKGHAKHIEEKLIEYFGSDLIESATSPREREFAEFDLIIMDYNYTQGNFTALDILGSKELDKNKLTYIIFISSHMEFEYENKTYKMTDSESRQALFRKYSSSNILEFKALLNYISKDIVNSKDTFFASIYETLLELESGKLMFESLFSLKKLLDKGVDDAFGKLLLTNSKTMKALITEKLESEGVSETSYLVDLSLSLVKNLITNSVSEMKEIHENLMNIQGWSCEIWDYETDNHLRELRRIELLDENINKRNTPIDFGDIFTFIINDENIRGILVSQSCDLIIREKDGDIQRNAEVASIILEVPKNKGKSCVNFRLGAEEIVFDVRKSILIPTWILDFVSLDSENGYSKFKIGQQNDRKFTWGSFFHTYIMKLVNDKSDYFKDLNSGEHIKWSMGIAYKLNKNNNDDIDFQISRKGRLDYLHTLSLLKHKTDIEMRVPLSLDLSKEEIKYVVLEAKLNNKETDLKFYYNEKDKVVLADGNDILDVIQAEGFKIKQEVRNELITKISTEHKGSVKLTEQFTGKRMLVINEETAQAFRECGIVIQTNKKKKSVDVKCRYNQLTAESQLV